jgi:hypothetical protein
MLRLSVAEEVAQLRDVKGDTGPLQLALRKRLEVLGDIFEANLFQRLALPGDPVQELPDAHLVVMQSAWRKAPFMPLKMKKVHEPCGIGDFRS